MGNDVRVLFSEQIPCKRVVGKMKKVLSISLLVFLFILAPMLSAFNVPAGGWGENYKLSTLNKWVIKNPKGEKLGEIEDFVMDPRLGQIAFVIFSNDGVGGIGQRVKIIPYEFLSFDETGKNFVLDVSKEDLISPVEVKNLKGEKLGEIEDFIMDSQGRIPFVMISRGDKMILIPYSALSIGTNSFVLDASEEKLASAPAFDEKKGSLDQAKAEEIYRYFGQSPYWTAE
jgi:sporulation protein YlmC with PRC-barrel domain